MTAVITRAASEPCTVTGILVLNIFHIKFTHIKNQEVLINVLLTVTCSCYLKYYKFMLFKCCESQEKLGQWLHRIVLEHSSEQHDSMEKKQDEFKM